MKLLIVKRGSREIVFLRGRSVLSELRICRNHPCTVPLRHQGTNQSEQHKPLEK